MTKLELKNKEEMIKKLCEEVFLEIDSAYRKQAESKGERYLEVGVSDMTRYYEEMMYWMSDLIDGIEES